MEKVSRPKPPVRRRKKFLTPGEDGKRVSAIEEHDEEGGEGDGGSTTTVVESRDQVNGNGGDAPAPQTLSVDAETGSLERSGEGSGEAEEGWEVISTHVPNINISAGDENKGESQQQLNQRCFLKKSKSEESASVNQVISPASPDILRTLTKKKKPPPFRPPPYNASLRTPPLPTKKRKAVTKLAEEAKKLVQTDGVSREAMSDPEEHQQLQQPAQPQQNQQEMVDGHIYEAVDPIKQDPTPPPVRLLENGHTKYLGSSSSDASLSPSLTRSTSVGNADSVFISGDVKQGGKPTVNFSTLRSARNSTSSGKKSRPHSEAVSSVSSARDFETSFEVSIYMYMYMYTYPHTCACTCTCLYLYAHTMARRLCSSDSSSVQYVCLSQAGIVF